MFTIDPNSNVPIFKQIIAEIERGIIIGEIKAGEFIPSVREFAVQYSINPNTVSKAYQILQSQNLVKPVRGKGLEVNGFPESELAKQRQGLLSEKISQLLTDSQRLGFSKDEVIQLIQKTADGGNK